MSDLLTRRDVMKSSGMIAVGLVTPRWLSAIAHSDVVRQAKGAKAASDSVLVVCQFTGGNDGLNMVVPYANSTYYQLRPTIGIPQDKVLHLNDDLGLHPGMTGVHDLYQKGQVAVVQNVGYPQPNRSHFRSMEIWQSASPDGALRGGWVGRHFDQQLTHGKLNPVVALGLSTEKPLALVGKQASVPCFASLADLKSMMGDPDAERMLRDIQGMDAMQGSATRVVQDANKTALDAISILQKQLGGYAPKQEYGNDPFGVGFKQIAQLIATSPATRVIYFSVGGFDTHARQVDNQAKLLQGFSNAIQAFQNEMVSLGKQDKVMTVVFSEFGRRAAENASQGTDHGKAAPMFVIGSKVKGGIYGPLPDLQNLNEGDVGFTQDFRGVYATALDQWMGGDSEIVLGSKFEHLGILK